jgi:hypothetical protein
MLDRIIYLICAGVALAACMTTPAPPPTHTPAPRHYPLPPRLRSPEYGIQVFLWWTEDGKTATNDLGLVRDMGFGWAKQVFAWHDVMPARGDYRWKKPDSIVALTEQFGLRLLVRLDGQPGWARADNASVSLDAPPDNLQDFGDYCSAVATRYKGRIAAYEVWNEPNLAREWGGQMPDPAAYVELLKVCYLAIKAADPQAMVISAGMAPNAEVEPSIALPDEAYYRGLYEAGAAPYFDLLGVHAPGYMNPPERSPDETEADPNLQARWITFRHVEDIRAIMLEYGDGDKQIAVTEMGWTTDPINPDYKWYAVTEAQRADYLVRAYQYAAKNWSPWIGLMTTVYIVNPFWTENDEQYWWAITRPVFPGDPPHLLPSYDALKQMEKVGNAPQ